MTKRIVEHGYSIAELLLAIAVIAVVAAAATPSLSDVHVRRLDAASAVVVDALRFARQESIRTGVAHGVRADSAESRLLVFRMDTTANPAVEAYDVVHPVSRETQYEVDLDDRRRTAATSLEGHFEIYTLATPHTAISFNRRGEPVDGATGLPLIAGHGGFVLNNGDRGTFVAVARLSGKIHAADIGAVIADPAAPF